MLRVSLPGLHNQQVIAMATCGLGSYSMAPPLLTPPCLKNCGRYFFFFFEVEEFDGVRLFVLDVDGI